jgi:hypothetical protein
VTNFHSADLAKSEEDLWFFRSGIGARDRSVGSRIEAIALIFGAFAGLETM